MQGSNQKKPDDLKSTNHQIEATPFESDFEFRKANESGGITRIRTAICAAGLKRIDVSDVQIDYAILCSVFLEHHSRRVNGLVYVIIKPIFIRKETTDASPQARAFAPFKFYYDVADGNGIFLQRLSSSHRIEISGWNVFERVSLHDVVVLLRALDDDFRAFYATVEIASVCFLGVFVNRDGLDHIQFRQPLHCVDHRIRMSHRNGRWNGLWRPHRHGPKNCFPRRVD
ncbi:MAG: hypothetical protein MZU97_19615 [Bacillus subtilis]|nr:hypothetical protein [Bacillus subtilis]